MRNADWVNNRSSFDECHLKRCNNIKEQRFDHVNQNVGSYFLNNVKKPYWPEMRRRARVMSFGMVIMWVQLNFLTKCLLWTKFLTTSQMAKPILGQVFFIKMGIKPGVESKFIFQSVSLTYFMSTILSREIKSESEMVLKKNLGWLEW